eukprot:c23638_g2_i3 orf=240-2048(+)
MAVSSLLLWREHSRWMVLIGACWVEAMAGLTYVFSTYSGALKTNLAYNQSRINTLAVAKDLGDHVGLVAGFLCRIWPNWAVLLLGASLHFAGYGSLWLLADQHIPALPFWLVCIIMFIGTNGSTFLDTAALVACIPNFPSNRATVVGLLKGFKGLCGAIFNQIYASFLAPDETSFILLIALGPAVVIVPLILLMGPGISAMQLTDTEKDNVVCRLLYAFSLVLAAYMLCVTLVQDLYSVSSAVNVVFTVVLFLILLLPLPVPKIADYGIKKHKERALLHLKDPLLEKRSLMRESDDCEGLQHGQISTSVITEAVQSSCSDNLAGESIEGNLVHTSSESSNSTSAKSSEKDATLLVPRTEEGSSKVEFAGPGDYMPLRKAFGNVNFWLLVFSIFFSMGSGTTAFNNLSQMAEAQGYENTQVFVSMSNIWNFTGRLAGGYASETSTRIYGHPRTLTLAGAQLIMAMGHVLFATALPGTIYIAVFLVALGYGAEWAIFPTALSELFGLQNFGVLYNFVNMASPAGSLVYSSFIAGPIYDWQARKQSSAASDDGTTLVCEGTVCFEITFFVMAGVCMMGAALSIALTMRTWTLYSSLHVPPHIQRQ